MLWDRINKQFPAFLESIYHETRALSQTHGNWQDQFNQQAGGLEAEQLIKLPSTMIQQGIRNNQVRLLDAQAPVLENWLKKQGVKSAKHFSHLFIKYAREFFLTKDPALHKIASFVERYLMERLVFNLSQQDNTPLPLNLLQKWIKGEPFKMIISRLSGSNPSSQSASQAVIDLLAPFGIDQAESFPLPPSLKKHLWLSIQKWLQESLPNLLAQAIPQWDILINQVNNQSELELFFEDSFIAFNLDHLINLLVDQGLQQLKVSNFSIAQQVDKFMSLSLEQRSALDEQWQDLLEDNESLDILKEFGKRCVKAFILQICSDFYKSYKQACEQQEMRLLFNEANEIETIPSSFMAWLMQEVNKACRLLAVEELSRKEIEILKKAIKLKNAISQEQDPDILKKERAKLAKLWPTLKPKFDHLAQHLLSILGYDHLTNLPVPKILQPHIGQLLKISYLPFYLNKEVI